VPYGAYHGEVARAGIPCRFKGPRDSLAAGIRIIFQELALAPDLSVAENVFLGRESARGFRLERERMESEAARRLAMLGLTDLDPAAPVRSLPVGLRQMVEIARALEPAPMGAGPEAAAPILILDEPTSALSLHEADALLAVLARLKAEGLGILYVSHKLEEVFAAADRISVLRNGRSMGTLPRSEASPPKIVSLMVGRALEEVFPPLPPAPDPASVPALSVRDWTVPSSANPSVDLLAGISFDVRPGEIVGLAGLMGAGRTELAMSLFGRSYGRDITGRVYKRGQEIRLRTVSDAIDQGIAYATEDRKKYGLNLIEDIKRNISAAGLPKLSNRGWVNGNEELKVAEEYRASMNIKTPSVLAVVGKLSGGNQQKVVLSKWIYTDADVLILDEPTRGIDVGAKYEIYTIINRMVAAGKAVVVISSELPELLGICDRIFTLAFGRITGEVPVAEASQERLMELMTQEREQDTVQ
jgi:putative multiple sugar transport system ATP-binding protein